ncbi:MAG: hypothetical protein JSS23_12345 [Proteobacteria bacterium]|nr:hypothetical protein [Pseudomonadota bacterium]
MTFDPDAYLAGRPQAEAFDPDKWLRENAPAGQSTWKNVANTLLTAANEALAGSVEGGMRSVASMPQMAAEVAELYTGLDQNQTEDEKKAKLATIRANTAQMGDALRAEGLRGRVVAGGLEALGQGADRVQDYRDTVRKALPVATEFANSIPGGVISGIGQVAAQAPLYLTGIGLPATVAQMYDQGYQDAKAHGSDEGTAALAGLGNMPGAALEFAADKLQLGPLLKLVKKGRGVAKPILSRAGEVVKVAGTEGLTEMAQQVEQNLVAGGLYDKDRKATEGMGRAGVVGALTGGMVRGGLEGADALTSRPAIDDTGQNIPEPSATLKAQQEQMREGRRPAMMFPKGTPESLAVPEGFERVETPRGIFHFDPSQVTADTVRELSGAGRENEILGLGSQSKPDAMKRAMAGDPPTVVTERTPGGVEVKGAVSTQSTTPKTVAELDALKTPGNTVAVETPQQTLLARLAADLEDNDRRQQEARQKEEQARAQRQAELQAKRDQFESSLAAAQSLAADKDADYPRLSAAVKTLSYYAEDNSLGLNLEQRQKALAEIARLAPRADAAREAYDARQADARAEAKRMAEAERLQQLGRRRAEREAFDAQAKAGIGADGRINYGRLDDVDLEARANAGDEQAGRELVRRAEQADDPRESLLDALAKVKLPATDSGLAAELKILREDMSPKQRMTLISRQKDSLDRTAEELRGRGFTEIVTPDDVITFTQRALRGEDIRAEPAEDQVEGVNFATENRLRIRPMEGLSPEEREHETRFAEQLNNATDAENDALYASLPESRGGSVLNTDIGREMDPEFRGAKRATLSQATHRPASRYIRDLLSRLLRREPQESPVLNILAGGSGSGKSTTLNAIHRPGSLVYDTTFSNTAEAIADVQEALDSGRMVKIDYVHRPIERAIAGAVGRAKDPQDGRTVPVSVIARSHYGAQQTAIAVAQHFGSDPRVALRVWDNSGAPGAAYVVSNPIDFLKAEGVRYDSENAVIRRAENEFSQHRDGLSEAQRQAFEPNDRRGISGVVYGTRQGVPRGHESRGARESGSAGDHAAVRNEHAPRILTDAEVEQQWAGLKSALGPIADAFELKVGMVADVLEAEGYGEEARRLRAGKLGRIAAATAPKVREDVNGVAADRQFIVVAAAAAKRGKAPGLLLHELAHPFFDGLPAHVREALRELHTEETTRRTGPLYQDGRLVTDIAITVGQLPAARVKADPDLPVKEWFAERVRRLNEDWLKGRMAVGDEPLLIRVARQLMDRLRRIFAQIRGIDRDGDLFTQTFREWLGSGTRANIAPQATAYAQRMRAQLATERTDGGRGEPATRAERETEANISDGAKDMKHAAAVGTPAPGATWVKLARMTPEQIEEEQAAIKKWFNDSPDAPQMEKALVHARLDGLRGEVERRAQAAHTKATGIRPVVDRKAALLAQWMEGKRLRDEGLKYGIKISETEGQAAVSRAKAMLDEEFPGWEEQAYRDFKTWRQRSEGVAQPRRGDPEDDGRNMPTEPAPEPTDTAGVFDDPPPPVRQGKANELHGHTAHVPTRTEKAMGYIRDALAGFRGALPELPTFPVLAAKTDRFIREKGGQFYNNLKVFHRILTGANDGIQREAEEQVAQIVKPLLDVDTQFSPENRKRLQQLQERFRRLRAEGGRIPADLTAEINGLQAKAEQSPYVLFERLMLALDLDWRQKHLLDDQGNPIALPFGVNTSEVAANLQSLGQKVEASPHKALIEQAVREHMALVKRIADDLKARELLASDHLSNPYYFPHITLQVKKGATTEERELRVERVRADMEADFRGYLIAPIGSRTPIETDYVRAMYYHLVQVGAHNQKADAIRRYVRPYNIREQVEEEARRMSKERGQTVSWQQAFHERYEQDDYVLYSPEEGDMFSAIQLDRDLLARRLGVMLTSGDLHQQLRDLGLKGITLRPEDVKEVLVQGSRETWVVPARVAETLRGISSRQQRSDVAIERAMSKAVAAWKKWKLFMPHNHIRYEYGNIVADLEKIFSATPGTFKYMPQAAREMREFFLGGKPSADLRAALEDGAINAITAAEVGQLQRLRAFEKFETRSEAAWRQVKARASSLGFQPITNLLGIGDLASVELSALREGITRYANFLHNLNAIRNGARPDYGGAYWKDIEAMGDSEPGANDRAQRQAAQISKATFGDYNDLSVNGQWLRSKLIPFYSWMEVNWKYHANLLRNLRDMVTDREMSRGRATAKGARALASFAVGTGSRVAGATLVRLALPYLAMAIWNNTGDREELEDQLSEEDRRRAHIIVGRNKEGKIDVIYANTALADVAKWFSGNKFMHQMGAWMAGKTDFVTAMGAWAQEIPGDLLNNTVGSIGPLAKVPVTILSRKAYFPDVLDARTIPAYDLKRNILAQMTDDFTADMVWRLVGKDYMASRDLGSWAKQIILQMRMRDPDQWAFYSVRDRADAFIQQRTGRTRSDFDGDSPDMQALRNFRRAIYTGDPAQAVRFYNRLLEYGYTAERFAASLRAQDPLSALPKKDGTRKAFIDSLDETGRAELRRAYQYASRLTGARGTERMLFPSEKGGKFALEAFRAAPRTQVLEGVIDRQRGRSDEQLVRDVEQDLARSLRVR